MRVAGSLTMGMFRGSKFGCNFGRAATSAQVAYVVRLPRALTISYGACPP